MNRHYARGKINTYADADVAPDGQTVWLRAREVGESLQATAYLPASEARALATWILEHTS